MVSRDGERQAAGSHFFGRRRSRDVFKDVGGSLQDDGLGGSCMGSDGQPLPFDGANAGGEFGGGYEMAAKYLYPEI